MQNLYRISNECQFKIELTELVEAKYIMRSSRKHILLYKFNKISSEAKQI